jgi:CMP-N,N'-diacetyllegionaminic acid synthase
MAFVLGIIPARGGSKGIPGKNIKLVAGKPLIAYSIQSALESHVLDDLVISTDSEEIAICASDLGVPTHVLRPSHLATDDAITIDVIIHEINKYETAHDVTVDILVLLQPTAPLRTGDDIGRAFQLYKQTGAESLVSVYEASSVHPAIMYTLNYEDGRMTPYLDQGDQVVRRQKFIPVFIRNGAIYIVSRRIIFEQNKLISDQPVAYVMPREKSINIDEPYDLELANWMMTRNESA